MPRLRLTVVLIIVSVTLIGCSVEKKLPRLNLEGTVKKQSKEKVLEKYLAGMKWQYADTSANALCQPLINADINLTFTVSSEDTIKGEGTIKYTNIKSQGGGLCQKCSFTPNDGKFSVAGKRLENSLTIKPTVSDRAWEQQIIDKSSCRTELSFDTNSSNHLIFSLEQAGFFDEWKISLPNTSSPSVKKFSFGQEPYSGWGELKIKLFTKNGT